jgi:hypothetical protein
MNRTCTPRRPRWSGLGLGPYATASPGEEYSPGKDQGSVVSPLELRGFATATPLALGAGRSVRHTSRRTGKVLPDGAAAIVSKHHQIRVDIEA